MRTPFKISFEKKIKNIDKDEIIRLFLINSQGKLHDKIEDNGEKKIIIKGKFFSLNPLDHGPWDLWLGFANKTELCFTGDNTIFYTVYFTYGIIYFIAVLLFFLLIPLIYSIKIEAQYLIFLSVVTAAFFIRLIIKILLHRRLFNRTLKYENRLLGNYNWTEILKKKTDNELRDIINGNTTLTLEIQELAKVELEKRKK